MCVLAGEDEPSKSASLPYKDGRILKVSVREKLCRACRSLRKVVAFVTVLLEEEHSRLDVQLLLEQLPRSLSSDMTLARRWPGSRCLQTNTLRLE